MTTPEHIIVGPEYKERKWYGRTRVYDKRSNRPKNRMRAAPVPTGLTYRYWRTTPRADQGETSQCVGYGAQRLLGTWPVVNRPWLTEKQLYDLFQLQDEWAGIEPDYFGTSVNAAMRTLRDLGAISSWSWADEADMVIRHLLVVGPVQIGVDWTAGMDDTDAKGYIRPVGSVGGGHSVCLTGANLFKRNFDGTVGAVRGHNNWGEWGDRGTGAFWLTRNDLQTLLDGLEGYPGEAAAAVEIRRVV